MALDNFSLLFFLALTSGLMTFSLAIISRGDARDGLRLWTVALGCEAAAWTFAALREVLPEILSVLLANLGLVAAQALKLAAVHQYRGLKWPRWQGTLPVLAMLLLLAWLPVADFRGRLIWGSLIYAVQFALIARALHYDAVSRGGRAWWLVYGATLAALPILGLRIAFALASPPDLAPQLLSHSPNPIQVAVFVGVIALNLLGALGFILLGKERTEHEMRHLATVDGLTGILNRRAFTERAEQELAGALRNRLPLSLLMLDIDHFKRVNDEFGHAAGDAVLIEFSRLIRQRLRRQDIFARYGGEEFCVLLPATAGKGAMVLAEDLRQVIEKHILFGQMEMDIPVTVTIGISVCGARCMSCSRDFAQITEEADRALYRGKIEGRNRCAVQFGCANAEADEPEAA